METRTRRKFSAEFKAKVVLEALRERQTLEQLSRKYEIHPTQIATWKREFIENASAAFSGGGDLDEKKRFDQEKDRLYAQIGQQKMEIDWLKKKL